MSPSKNRNGLRIRHTRTRTGAAFLRALPILEKKNATNAKIHVWLHSLFLSPPKKRKWRHLRGKRSFFLSIPGTNRRPAGTDCIGSFRERSPDFNYRTASEPQMKIPLVTVGFKCSAMNSAARGHCHPQLVSGADRKLPFCFGVRINVYVKVLHGGAWEVSSEASATSP